jgi:hypothetical protein
MVTEMPKRIQMSRQHPWRADNPDAVIVARPSKWGNPYRITTERIDGEKNYILRGSHVFGVTRDIREARAWAVEMFELNVGPMGAHEYDRETLAELDKELRGRDLACWCPLDQPCHGDVLLELANP